MEGLELEVWRGIEKKLKWDAQQLWGLMDSDQDKWKSSN